MCVKILLLGHSFVRDLSAYVSRCSSRRNLNLDQEQKSVVMTGRPGMLLRHLSESLSHVVDHSPDVVLLDIGGNDIDYGRVPVQDLADQLFVFCRLLLASYGVKVVEILEVPFRTRVCRGRWRSVDQLNMAILSFNSVCKDMWQATQGQRVRFHHHIGLVAELRT
jgi:hypothetical protein